jgi:hypothetical protein
MYRASAFTVIAAGLVIGGTDAHAATGEGGDANGATSVTQIAVAAAPAGAGNDGEDTVSPAPAELASSDPDSGWAITVTPYIWAAGMSGDIALPRFGQSVTVDQSFSDTLEDLDFAFMGTLEVRKQRFVMFGDIMYLNLGTEAESIAGNTFVSGDIDASMLIGTAAVGYRLVDEGPAFVDVFAGTRIVSLDVDVDLAAPGIEFSGGASPSDVSTMFGVRSRIPLSERLALGVYGDIGSFFDDADLKWQLMGTLHYAISDRWTAVAGYRHLSIDHESANLVFDVDLSGPLLGFSYRF